MALAINQSRSSPNTSARDGATINLIVLHATVGSFVSSLAWLCNPLSEVSTHYLIAKNGAIYQLVLESHAAHHAGKSAWRGLDSGEIRCQSIGIELVNSNSGSDPYPAAQIESTRALCADLIARYAIVPSMVARHLDIATPPGRKTDPAGFPFAAFLAALYPPTTHAYRAIMCAPVFQDRKPDAIPAGSIPAGSIERMDDLTGAYLHLESGFGFSPVSCWEPV